MDPIKNVGAVDYTMAVPQNQNQVQGYEDYSSMPMVYEPEIEQKKQASSKMLGMTALGVLGAVGIGVGIAKHRQVSGLKTQINDLTKAKDEALKAKDAAVKAKEETDKALNKERTLSIKDRLIRLFNPEYKLSKEEIEARNAAKKAKTETDNAAKEANKADKADKADGTKKDDKADKKDN